MPYSLLLLQLLQLLQRQLQLLLFLLLLLLLPFVLLYSCLQHAASLKCIGRHPLARAEAV